MMAVLPAMDGDVVLCCCISRRCIGNKLVKEGQEASQKSAQKKECEGEREREDKTRERIKKKKKKHSMKE